MKPFKKNEAIQKTNITIQTIKQIANIKRRVVFAWEMKVPAKAKQSLGQNPFPNFKHKNYAPHNLKSIVTLIL